MASPLTFQLREALLQRADMRPCDTQRITNGFYYTLNFFIDLAFKIFLLRLKI